MLKPKLLKAGDLLRIDHDPETGYAVVKLARITTILCCTKDDPKKIPNGTVITYLGIKNILNEKTGKIFFGCYYNEQIVYISEYFIKDFTKIEKGTK